MLGLGNPGEEFAGSRHNVGADTVHLLADRCGGRLRGVRGLRAHSTTVQIQGHPVVLAVPTTYMNDSGAVVRALLERSGVDDLHRLLVVHDELDLPPGALRLKVGGGMAGHNGLRSLRDHLHSADFCRVRIGIGKPPRPEAGATYVLRRVPRRDRTMLDEAVATAADAVELVVTSGMETAMNRYNATVLPGGGGLPGGDR